jgi:hypothetical protein
MKKKVEVVKSDFLVTDLPSNRKELFIDILKNQWRNLILMSFIILVILLPIIILRYYNLVIVTNMINSNEVENIKNNIFNSYIGYSLINSFIIIITGILFGGVLRIYKKLSFNDGFFLVADFIKGIKENFKDFFVIFSFYAFFNLLLEVLCINFLLENNYLYYFFKVINYFILFPIILIWVSLSTIYSDNVMVKLKSAYRLYIRYLFKILLFFILLILPLFLLAISNSYVQLILPIVYSLIYFPYIYLIFILFMNHIFDEQINKKNFPDLVGKGMYHN